MASAGCALAKEIQTRRNFLEGSDLVAPHSGLQAGQDFLAQAVVLAVPRSSRGPFRRLCGLVAVTAPVGCDSLDIQTGALQEIVATGRGASGWGLGGIGGFFQLADSGSTGLGAVRYRGWVSPRGLL